MSQWAKPVVFHLRVWFLRNSGHFVENHKRFLSSFLVQMTGEICSFCLFCFHLIGMSSVTGWLPIIWSALICSITICLKKPPPSGGTCIIWNVINTVWGFILFDYVSCEHLSFKLKTFVSCISLPALFWYLFSLSSLLAFLPVLCFGEG